MNKKIIFLLVTLIMLATTVFGATADVQLNGNIIDFTDSEGNKVDAQIINNRTLVPLRKIFEELGCNVEWEQDTLSPPTPDIQKQLKDPPPFFLRISQNLFP